MKNILDELACPYEKLYGRPRFVCDWIPRQEIDEKSILNVGCGYGWFERFVTEYRSPLRVVGVEPSETDLSTARRSLADLPVELIVASGLRIPLPAESFDTCLCTEVIEHIPRGTEPQLLRAIHRVLKPGGKCYLTTPSAAIVSKFTDPAFYLTAHRHYSEPQLAAFVAAAGFELCSAVQKGKLAELLFLYNLYISKWIFRRGPFAEQWLAERVNREYQEEGGFMGLFCILKKVAGEESQSRRSP